MAPPRTYTNEVMKAALAETKGLIYLAARRLGCAPKTIRARARTSAEVAECIADQRGEIVDTAELRLYQKVLDGDMRAVAYTLSTLGKDRGYVRRSELTGKEGGPLDVVEVVVRDRQEAVALLEYIKRDRPGEEQAQAPPEANGEAEGLPAGDAGAG